MSSRMSFIPSLFTVLNLFCGFLSVVNASNGNLEAACMFIIYAGLFDAFDGVVARFTGTSSRQVKPQIGQTLRILSYSLPLSHTTLSFVSTAFTRR